MAENNFCGNKNTTAGKINQWMTARPPVKINTIFFKE